MAVTVGQTPDQTPDQPSRSKPESMARGRLNRFLASKPAVVGLVVIIILFLATLIGPHFSQDPNVTHILDKFQSPSHEHRLGTDAVGRDILARVLLGGRVSFIVAFCATGLAVLLGGVLGVTAGYSRRWVDEGVSRVFDTLLAFPLLLLAIVILAALGPTMPAEILAIGISDTPRFGRLYRALTLEAKDREYVKSAKVLGYSRARIIFKHILPNIYVSVLVIATGNLGKTALAEAALSFLGIGVQRPTPSWGNMIADGRPYLQYAAWIALVPGIALTAFTLSFAFLGDGLRDAFDVREGGPAK
jgi:peptide/nickel transport system permease protein